MKWYERVLGNVACNIRSLSRLNLQREVQRETKGQQLKLVACLRGRTTMHASKKGSEKGVLRRKAALQKVLRMVMRRCLAMRFKEKRVIRRVIGRDSEKGGFPERRLGLRRQMLFSERHEGHRGTISVVNMLVPGFYRVFVSTASLESSFSEARKVFQIISCGGGSVRLFFHVQESAD